MAGDKIPCMRMNIVTQMSSTLNDGAKTIPLSLTIRPSCGVPGDYQFATDSAALMRMLHKKTDLSRDTLTRFEGEMYSFPSARLMGVELSESVLTEIGYFID
jgi:hypothetical protein